MDPATLSTILSIAIPVLTFLLGHFHVILPAPTPVVNPPTGIGHGEWIKFLEQILSNILSKLNPAPVPGPAPAPVPTPAPAPVPPNQLDLNQLLNSLLLLLEKVLTQNQSAPPKV